MEILKCNQREEIKYMNFFFTFQNLKKSIGVAPKQRNSTTIFPFYVSNLTEVYYIGVAITWEIGLLNRLSRYLRIGLPSTTY
jgi:hypothetical protein